MYAVVEIAGRQYRVTPKDRITVPTLARKVGEAVRFDRVLLVEGERGISVGNPVVHGAAVQGTVLEHDRAEKVIVFKKRPRKGYKVMRGHRQGFTRVEITTIEA